jgi:hypothetical protein
MIFKKIIWPSLSITASVRRLTGIGFCAEAVNSTTDLLRGRCSYKSCVRACGLTWGLTIPGAEINPN